MHQEARKSPHAALSQELLIFSTVEKGLLMVPLFFECFRREALLEYQREASLGTLLLPSHSTQDF